MKAESGFQVMTAGEPDRPDAEEGMPAPGHEGNGRLAVFLHPGRVFASAKPCVVRTILGSCVAVCLWDPLLGIGGANHFVLPYSAENGQNSARFGNVAVQRLIETLLALGSTQRDLKAKLFGGSWMLRAFRENHLGKNNVQMAYTLLADAGIPIVAEDVGGRQGRKVIFQTHDGTAWVRRL